MTKEKISSKLATPSDLKPQDCLEIANLLNPIIANSFALYVKTKNFHWHLSGSHFRDYHLLLDEQGDQIFATIDVLAERLRKLGQLTLRSIGHISRVQTIKDDEDLYVEPKDMMQRLMEDNQACAKQMRQAHHFCHEHGDVATASLLEVFVDETEKRIWFLFEIIQSHGVNL